MSTKSHMWAESRLRVGDYKVRIWNQMLLIKFTKIRAPRSVSHGSTKITPSIEGKTFKNRTQNSLKIYQAPPSEPLSRWETLLLSQPNLGEFYFQASTTKMMKMFLFFRPVNLTRHQFFWADSILKQSLMSNGNTQALQSQNNLDLTF